MIRSTTVQLIFYGGFQMLRRQFILGAAAAAAATPLGAEITNGPFGSPSRAWVYQPAVVKQNCPLWCWAASASMIFAAAGRTVPQEQIVQRVFGGLTCQPAYSGMVMAQVLSSTWTDTNGQQFQSHVGAAYDQMAGVAFINNGIIVSELAANRPLLY